MASKLSSFLAELKRRKVYHVAVVYVVVGFGVASGAQYVFEMTGLGMAPAWLVAILVILGFPIALVLAWAYEVRPEEPRESEKSAASVPRPSTSADRESIVVLPFDNMSPDPSDAYFADGLTEELVAELSCVGGLRVISRTTAMKLKGSDKDIATIGRDLNVQHVLEGSVRKAGNALRITAQLIDATTDEHLWAERYSGTMDDVFEIQETMARKIVDQLKVSLSPDEDDRLAKPRIAHAVAYECHLRAKQHLTEFTADGIDRAIGLLEKALEIEGPNELLFSTLGLAHTRLLALGMSSDEALVEEAEALAAKAFEINPDSPGGHVVRGSILSCQGRVQEAVAEFKQALRYDPENSSALGFLAMTAEHSGQVEAARGYFQRLAAVDPMSEGLNPTRSSFYNGEFEEAVEGFRVEWEVDPESPSTRWAYGVCLAWAGQIDEGAELLDRVADDDPTTTWGLFARFCAAALQGDRDRALAAMTPDLETLGGRQVQLAWMIGSCYAILGMVEESVAWLRQAMTLGFINYPFLAEHEPFFARIRSEPAVQDVFGEIKERWEAFEP
ncbi:MAG: tetratricopeptide repeat protein [Gemmatimonadota bacterium]